MQKILLLCCTLWLLCAAALGEEIPSLRQPNDADLDAGIYDSYFDDAVFVGDSVTNQLFRYIREQRSKGKTPLGDVRFLAVDNYSIWIGCHSNLYGKVRLKYRGNEVTLHGGLNAMKAGKVFVLLGLNDHAGDQLEADVRRYGLIIDHVFEKNPDIHFVAQSCTPLVKAGCGKTLNKKNIDAFNARLEALCEEKGVAYLDIATPLMGEDGYLPLAYAYDRQAHMNDKGLKIWLNTLRSYARDQYELGLWQMNTEEE